MRDTITDILARFPGTVVGPAARLPGDKNAGNYSKWVAGQSAKLLTPSVEAFEVLLPVRVYAAGNAREAHWSARQKRIKAMRQQVRESIESLGLANVLLWLPVAITLTRVGGRKLDTDNLAYSLKGARDEWATFIHADDGDESKVTWSYAQQPGRVFGLRVRVERRDG